MSRRVGRAFIEAHRDIAIQIVLDLHGLFGRQCMRRAIEMRPEGYAVLGQIAKTGEGHHLVAATVREDRPRPIHEFV